MIGEYVKWYGMLAKIVDVSTDGMVEIVLSKKRGTFFVPMSELSPLALSLV